MLEDRAPYLVIALDGADKTLAKLANHTAKRLQVHTGGVVNLCGDFERDWVLRNTAVSEVWGVGRRMTAHLEGMGITTAMHLAKADPWTLRKKFSVVIEKPRESFLERRAWSWMNRIRRNRKSAAAECLASD